MMADLANSDIIDALSNSSHMKLPSSEGFGIPTPTDEEVRITNPHEQAESLGSEGFGIPTPTDEEVRITNPHEPGESSLGSEGSGIPTPTDEEVRITNPHEQAESSRTGVRITNPHEQEEFSRTGVTVVLFTRRHDAPFGAKPIGGPERSDSPAPPICQEHRDARPRSRETQEPISLGFGRHICPEHDLGLGEPCETGVGGLAAPFFCEHKRLAHVRFA